MTTSVMERDIGPHEHSMVIWLSYEIYAVCTKCGYHDWSDLTLEQFKEKYPNARIERQ